MAKSWLTPSSVECCDIGFLTVGMDTVRNFVTNIARNKHRIMLDILS